MKVHIYANLCISLVTACTFGPPPKQECWGSPATNMTWGGCPVLPCPPCLRKFPSPHGWDPASVQFSGVFKSQRGKDIARKKVKSEDTDWLQHKQGNPNSGQGFQQTVLTKAGLTLGPNHAIPQKTYFSHHPQLLQSINLQLRKMKQKYFKDPIFSNVKLQIYSLKSR